MSRIRKSLLACTAVCGVGLGVAMPMAAFGQTTAEREGSSDIIVTARKRDETLMQTPVIITAIPAQQIENLRINNMGALASVAPGLQISDAFAAVGASVYLRGLGNGDTAAFIDQSVGLNIDGMSLSHGSFFRLGMFDVGQIEVMKGPQALFFGKSTSAGIIAIHSADPTPDWEMKLAGGYEFHADETAFDGYVSGPISDDLGFRLAGFYSNMKGYLYTPNPNARDTRLGASDAGARMTLKYDGDAFRAKLKLSWMRSTSQFPAMTSLQGTCSGATFQKNGPAGDYDNCQVDNITAGRPNQLPYSATADFTPGSPAYFTNTPYPIFGDGDPYSRNTGLNAVLNMDFDMADGLTLSSVTGFARIVSKIAGATPLSAGSTYATVFEFAGDYRQNDFSQELRMTSDWDDSWINFMVGVLYNRTEADDLFYYVIPGFATAADNRFLFVTDTWSGFGQVLLTPVDKFELSVGARYTDIVRSFDSLVLNNFFGLPSNGEQINSIPRALTRVQEHDVSPEVTLSYRPTSDLTIFASYKQGYKGPGFNADTTAVAYIPGSVFPFGGEKARGFEGGIKAQLLDRSLNLTLSGYRYNYRGIQVSYVENAINVAVRNAADARVQGVEFTANYTPRGLSGLTLNAFLNYNDAKWTDFPGAVCYGNQGPAGGCAGATLDPFGNWTGGAQDLSGRRLHKAPKWTGQLGGEYKFDLGDKLFASLGANATYSSRYNATPEQNPTAIQKSYVTLDATVRLGETDGWWELGLIGRNLTNKYIMAGGIDNGAAIPGLIADGTVYTYRPRQVMLQLTLRPQIF